MGSKVARWFQNPYTKSMDPYFTNPDKQATCSLSPTRADAAVPTWAPTDTVKRERTPNRPHQDRGPGGRVATPVACHPTPHARGCGGHGARAPGDACARKGGGGGAPRASRWARPSARVRAPRFLPHVPRASRPLPAGSAHLPPSRGVSLGLSEPHIPRSFCQGRRLRRGSRPAAQPQRLSAAPLTNSPSSATPCPFPALLSHPVHRESLDTKQAGLRRGLEKWRCRAWIMPSTAPPAPVKR